MLKLISILLGATIQATPSSVSYDGLIRDIQCSPVAQLHRSTEMTAFTVTPDTVEIGLPNSANPSSAFDRTTTWIKVKGSATWKDGSRHSITLFFPCLTREDVSYSRRTESESSWIRTKTDDPELEYLLSSEPALGLQIQYPKSTEISAKSHFLVLSDHPNDSTVTAFGVLPLGTRESFCSPSISKLYLQLLRAYHIRTNWQYRQVTHWIAGLQHFPSEESSKEAKPTDGSLWKDADLQKSLENENGYRKIKLLECRFYQFGDAKVVPELLGLILSQSETDSYFRRNLDPSWLYTNPWLIGDKNGQRKAQARAMLERGVVNIEVQLIADIGYDDLTIDSCLALGANVYAIGKSTLGENLKAFFLGQFKNPSSKLALTSSQRNLLNSSQEYYPQSHQFIQEYCRWKLGRPTAPWFPKD